MGAVWGAGVLPLPASREARRRAAVTPQPTGFPSSSPALYGRGMGCRGTTPAREPRGPSPSGGNSQPTRFPPPPLRASGAQSGVQGVTPCSGEDAAEVFAGLLGGVDQEVAHVQLDGLARFNADALVGIGNDAQLFAAAKVNAAVVHIA